MKMCILVDHLDKSFDKRFAALDITTKTSNGGSICFNENDECKITISVQVCII
jgi:hypothetical protein